MFEKSETLDTRLQQRLRAELRADQRSVEKTETPFKCSHVLAVLTPTLTRAMEMQHFLIISSRTWGVTVPSQLIHVTILVKSRSILHGSPWDNLKESLIHQELCLNCFANETCKVIWVFGDCVRG